MRGSAWSRTTLFILPEQRGTVHTGKSGMPAWIGLGLGLGFGFGLGLGLGFGLGLERHARLVERDVR